MFSSVLIPVFAVASPAIFPPLTNLPPSGLALGITSPLITLAGQALFYTDLVHVTTAADINCALPALSGSTIALNTALSTSTALIFTILLPPSAGPPSSYQICWASTLTPTVFSSVELVAFSLPGSVTSVTGLLPSGIPSGLPSFPITVNGVGLSFNDQYGLFMDSACTIGFLGSATQIQSVDPTSAVATIQVFAPYSSVPVTTAFLCFAPASAAYSSSSITSAVFIGSFSSYSGICFYFSIDFCQQFLAGKHVVGINRYR